MTRQQQWAIRAHQQVLQLKTKSEKGKHKTYAMKLPGLIHQSGLVQTLAFLRTREAGGRDFVDAVASVYGARSGDVLVQRVQNAALPEYLAMSRDVVSVAEWIRRFVQIEMQDIDEVED
jgi:CRISPR-associated protein Cmr5